MAVGAREPGVTRARRFTLLVFDDRRAAMLGSRPNWGGQRYACVGRAALVCGARAVFRLVGLDYERDTFSIRTGSQGNQIKTCLEGVAHNRVF